jgi:hypothetical protein
LKVITSDPAGESARSDNWRAISATNNAHPSRIIEITATAR